MNRFCCNVIKIMLVYGNNVFSLNIDVLCVYVMCEVSYINVMRCTWM